MKQAMIDFAKRGAFDELYTPESIVYPLLKSIPKEVKRIWCPADTEKSNIVKVLRESGYEVITSHIDEGINFINTKIECDMIITNPPFSLKNDFLEWAYSFHKPFSFLLPLTALEGVFRGKLFMEHGIDLIVLTKRPDFTGKGKPWFGVGWFTHRPYQKTSHISWADTTDD